MELFYIEQVLKGDASGFSYLVDTYKHMAYSVAYSIVNNKEDAEDAVQDAFVKAYRSLHQFRHDSKFSTWFYRIVVNTALTKLKKQKQERVIATEDVPDSELHETETTYTKLAQADQRKYIDLSMDKLPAEDRLLLTLYYLHGHTMEEITEITQVTGDNLKMKIHRARRKMLVVLGSLLQSEIKTLL